MSLYVVRNTSNGNLCKRGQVMTYEEALALHFRLGDAGVHTPIEKVTK